MNSFFKGDIILLIKKIVHYLLNSKYRFLVNSNLGLNNYLPDAIYLKKYYQATFGYALNLNNPKSFNEKLQWLKLFDRHPIYTTMVDKYAVKDYVSNLIGVDYVIPTIGVWNSFEQIDFDSLPNQFVLKCTHDSGGLAICKDKDTFDFDAARKKINKSLKRNYYFLGREWPYKNVKPRIIAEEYLSNNNQDIVDYKFYCFNGVPKFLYVSEGLSNHQTASISFLTLDWSFAPFHRSDYKEFSELPQKPYHFNEMIEIAKVLSKDIPFIRVDLYEVENHIYFSELTFFPASGMMPLEPEEWDYKLGEMLVLPEKKRE